jgi:hypothetical protein
MSDQDDTPNDTRESRYLKGREAAKEHAKKLRREAYLKAKELSKAQRLERQNTPEANERKLRLREQRRQAYLKAKESYKQRVEQRREEERLRAQREADEAQALRDAELLQTLTTADKMTPKTPRLRLVKPGDTT